MNDLLSRVPTPVEVRVELGRAIRELALLRRLYQLSKAIAEERAPPPIHPKEDKNI